MDPVELGPLAQFSAVTVLRSLSPALRAVSVDIHTGLTVLVGPNGAGKSTLFETMLGLHRPRTGTVQLLGRDPARGHKEVASLVGWMPQDPILSSRLRLHEMVTYAAWLKGLTWAAAHKRADRAIEVVSMKDHAAERIGSLSGGMKRRAALACAIVHEPRVLLLDEPLNGLDPGQRRRFRELVVEYVANASNVGVVLSTHVLADVASASGRIVALDRGRVIFTGGISDFMNKGDDPDDAYSQVFSHGGEE